MVLFRIQSLVLGPFILILYLDKRISGAWILIW
jgi:hypothetical protein